MYAACLWYLCTDHIEHMQCIVWSIQKFDVQHLVSYLLPLVSLQRSWVGATKKQRDELLDFIRHLAEDDKEGVMATKVGGSWL